MTWRRIAPWVIGVIALVAIFINLPRTTLGLDWLPDECWASSSGRSSASTCRAGCA